jgi:hypothetical protein
MARASRAPFNCTAQAFIVTPAVALLPRFRAAAKKHPDYSEHEYFLSVETAFKQWEAIQNTGR